MSCHHKMYRLTTDVIVEESLERWLSETIKTVYTVRDNEVTVQHTFKKLPAVNRQSRSILLPTT